MATAFVVCVVMGWLWLISTLWTRRQAAFDEAAATGVYEEPFSGLRPGPANLVGALHARGDLLESPWTKTPCLYYSFIVHEFSGETTQSDGRRTRRSVVRVQEQRATHAVLGGASPQVHLSLPDAKVSIEHDEALGANSETIPDDLRQLLADRYQFKPDGLIFNRDFSVTESFIRPGEIVTATGVLDRGGTDFALHASDHESVRVSQGRATIRHAAVNAATPLILTALLVVVIAFGGLIVFALWQSL